MHSTDDLELIRELVSEPGPSAPARSRGRAALMALAERDGETAGQQPPARSGRPARTRRLALAGGGTAVLAGAAAAAVLIATAGTGAPQPGHAAAGQAAPSQAAPSQAAGHHGAPVPSAQHVLLTAARQAGAAPAAAGRFWVTRAISGTNMAVGAAGHRYVITDRGSDDQWTARAAGGSSEFISRSLGARPATAADTAAWRQAGSPRHWLVTVIKSGRRGRLRIPAAAGKPFGGPTNDGAKIFAIGSRNVSMRQLRRLPVTTAGLKAALLHYFAEPGATGGDLPASATAWLWQTGTGMITDMPLSPAQRAATYRLLAGLHGVRSLGTVTDPAGRNGTAVELTSPTGAAGTEASILIVSPRTGLPLATAVRVVRAAGLTAGLRPGTLASYEIIRFAGWSDTAPPAIPHS